MFIVCTSCIVEYLDIFGVTVSLNYNIDKMRILHISFR